VDVGVPQNLAGIFADVKDEFNIGNNAQCGMNPNLLSIDQFAKGYFMAPLRLNIKVSDSEPDNVRALSGVDSKQSSTTVLWKTSGTSVPGILCTPQLFLGTTQILRVAAGRQLDLVS
jgi:hypothetical protein